jgi:hypothetical protein
MEWRTMEFFESLIGSCHATFKFLTHITTIYVIECMTLQFFVYLRNSILYVFRPLDPQSPYFHMD